MEPPIFSAAALFHITIFCEFVREFFDTRADIARVSSIQRRYSCLQRIPERKKGLSRGMAGPSQLAQHRK
jgi:hypothetical protein